MGWRNRTCVALASLGALAMMTGVLSSAAQLNPSAADGKPVNLKVLPKNTSMQNLNARMKAISRDLGVTCNVCHEQDADSKQIDFASDANPMKDTARAMMRMTDDINTKYLSLLGDRRYSPPITCGNCHLGQIQPPTFEGKQAP